MRWVALAALLVLASPVLAQDARGPIEVYDDEDWLSPTSGVRSGSGTAEDPYIVSGWRIERPLVDLPSRGVGIHIENTEAHVIVRNVVIEQRFAVGLEVLESSNVRFEQITLDGQQTGATFQDVTGLRIEGLSVSGTAGPTTRGGLIIQGAPGAVLRNIDIRDGQGPGFVLAGSDGVLLQAILVVGHEGGLRISSLRDLIAIGVEAHANTGDGLLLANVTGIDGRGIRATSQASASGQGGGRGLVGWASTGTLQGVHIAGNHGDGAHVWDGRLELRDARFLGNGGVGLLLAESDGRLFAAESHDNGGHGVAVYAPASKLAFSRIVGLQTHDNGGAGLYVQGLQGAHVEAVRADRNGQSGIDVRGSENLTIIRSHAQQNMQAGVLTVQSQGGQVVDSRAQENAGSGFSFRSTHGLSVHNNTAVHNGQSGFVLDGTGLVLRNNRALENGDFGIELLGTAGDAVLESNTLVGNGYGNAGDDRERRLPAPWLTALALLVIARRSSIREAH